MASANPSPVIHEVSCWTSPIANHAKCSCGWSHQERRQQNAWGRAAKMRAAINKHLSEDPAR